MRRPGQGRGKTARHLVFALGARLEAADAALDAKLDALVVAGLEVQAVMLRGRPPVASIQRFLAPEKYCRGDRFGLVEGDLEHQRLPEGARDFTEELARQVRFV